MQKEITLNGKPVAVSFTLTTLLTYEELTDSNFFGEQFENRRHPLNRQLAGNRRSLHNRHANGWRLL